MLSVDFFPGFLFTLSIYMSTPRLKITIPDNSCTVFSSHNAISINENSTYSVIVTSSILLCILHVPHNWMPSNTMQIWSHFTVSVPVIPISGTSPSFVWERQWPLNLVFLLLASFIRISSQHCNQLAWSCENRTDHVSSWLKILFKTKFDGLVGLTPYHPKCSLSLHLPLLFHSNVCFLPTLHVCQTCFPFPGSRLPVTLAAGIHTNASLAFPSHALTFQPISALYISTPVFSSPWHSLLLMHKMYFLVMLLPTQV